MEHMVVGPQMLQYMKQNVREEKKIPKVAHDCQKSYVDLKRQHKEFNVGDHIYL